MLTRVRLCAVILTLAGGVYAEVPQCWRVPVAGGSERWCWWADGGIFSPDRLRPELAAIFDGRELVHGSRVRAATSIHRSRLVDINPLPVPLDPRGLPATAQVETEPLPEGRLTAARALLDSLRASRAPVFRYRLRDGERTVMLPEDRQPFAGYDWATPGAPIAAGTASPLGKYDALVAHADGRSPRTMEWGESRRGSWGQGWAASAILVREPNRLLWDPSQQRVIFVSDVKGMLAASGVCADRAVFRVRQSPAMFHKALTYYLEELRKPMVIGQLVVSGFRARLRSAGDGYRVEMTLRVHQPERVRDEIVGIAPDDELTLRYWIPEGAGDGYWVGRAPSKLWSPVAMRACGGVDPGRVMTLVGKLADAERKSARFEDRRPGSGYQVSLHGGVGQGQLVARGERLYPDGHRSDQTSYREFVADATDAQVFIPLSNLSSLRWIGSGKAPAIERIEFWGGDAAPSKVDAK